MLLSLGISAAGGLLYLCPDNYRTVEPSDLMLTCCFSAANGWLVPRPTNSLAPHCCCCCCIGQLGKALHVNLVRIV